MQFADVKKAVLAGLRVCWCNERYQVVHTDGQWLVGWDIGGRQENYAGLSNHREADFYVSPSSLSWAVDDTGAIRTVEEAKAVQLSGTPARFVGYRAGAELCWAAVWSYLGVPVYDSEAEDIATDLLMELNWFADLEQVMAEIII